MHLSLKESEQTKMKIKNKIKQMVFSTIAGVLSVCSIQGVSTSFAQVSDEQLRNDITRAVQDMESIMQKSYDHAKDELSTQCASGYDYELSLESFYDQGLPFAGYDYQQFIAAYATIQQYCFDHGHDIGEGINSIQFVNMETTPTSLQEYAPEKVTKYSANADGTYSEAGTMYLTEPGEIYTYEKNDEGKFVRTGTEYRNLGTVDTAYLEVQLSTIGPDEIYETFGLNRADFLEEEERRLARLKELVGQSQLSQLTFLMSDVERNASDDTTIARALQLSETSAQQILITIAGSLLGRIPYEWGGKSDKAGFDDSWYLFDSSERQKGLDCSGYIQWILRTAGFEGWDQLSSTSDFLSSDLVYQISAEDLRPGDLGLFYPDSTSRTNHIGMYLGDGYWIHCSSSKRTVVIANNMKFSIFRRLNIFNPTYYTEIPQLVDTTEPIVEEAQQDQQVKPSQPAQQPQESQEQAPVAPVLAEYHEELGTAITTASDELMLMAKVVTLESYGEGYNGWVGVAEVIKNRTLHPDQFAGTITGVLSANKQFSTYRKATQMSDSAVDPNVLQVCQKVVNGELSIFGNTSVVGFKRASSGDQKWGKWTKYCNLGNHDFYSMN